jgi:hypothetical protein
MEKTTFRASSTVNLHFRSVPCFENGHVQFWFVQLWAIYVKMPFVGVCLIRGGTFSIRHLQPDQSIKEALHTISTCIESLGGNILHCLICVKKQWRLYYLSDVYFDCSSLDLSKPFGVWKTAVWWNNISTVVSLPLTEDTFGRLVIISQYIVYHRLPCSIWSGTQTSTRMRRCTFPLIASSINPIDAQFFFNIFLPLAVLTIIWVAAKQTKLSYTAWVIE